jgi:hypothetical protein
MAKLSVDGSLLMADGRKMWRETPVTVGDLAELVPLYSPPPMWPFVASGGGGGGGARGLQGPPGPAGPGNGWQDDGTVVRLVTPTDQVVIGDIMPCAGEKLRVTGGAVLIDFTSTSALKVQKTGCAGAVGFIVDTTNQRIGQGLAVPLFDIHGQGTIDPVGGYNDAYGATAAPNWQGRRARGTPGAPTAILTDDLLVTLGGRGFDGAAFSTFSTGSIKIPAAQNWAPGAHGTHVDTETTGIGSTVRLKRMRVHANGQVLVGGLAPFGTELFHVFGSEIIDGAMYLTAIAADPGAIAAKIAVYCKTVAGVTQLFVQRSNGTVLQLS